MTDKPFKLSPLETFGGPVFVKPRIDLEQDKEEREKERFEMLCKAFDSLPTPKPVMCRCYVDYKEDKND